MAPKRPQLPSFGVLNDINKPIVQDRIDLEQGTTAGIFRKIAERSYTPDAVSNTGPYKAIVLKVEENPTKSEAGSWLNTFFDETPHGSFVRIKARIPEIHSMLPIPRSWGNGSDDHAAIEMYPTFTAQKQDVEKPVVGSIVWVDFGNKTNFTDPIYIGPVIESKTPVIGYGAVSPANLHLNSCAGSFNSDSPVGDPISGRNKALAHTGLPLLPRATKKEVSKESKIIIGNRASPEIVTKWKNAVNAKGVPGISWIGNLDANGSLDERHNKGKRDTIIFAPNTTNFTNPLEIIYYFHGLGGFGNIHDFRERINPQIARLSKDNRNFVIVIPELPWSSETSTPHGRQQMAFRGRDNFYRFHGQVQGQLRTSFSNEIEVKFITLVAHGAGGAVLRTISNTNAITSVRPNKIVMADCDYYGVAQILWDKYFKENENIELNILTKKSGTPFNKAKEFLKKNNLPGKSRKVYVESLNKTHRSIGDMSIEFINPVEKRRVDENYKRVSTIPPESPAREEEKTLEEDPTEEKNTPPKLSDPQGRIPNAPNNNRSPSAISKNSTTRKPLPSGVVIRESQPYREARVYVRDYGSLSRNANSPVDGKPLLVKVNGGKLLHRLAAARFNKLNEAWLREHNNTVPAIRVVSGLRNRRWRSREHYEDVLFNKYKSRVAKRLKRNEEDVREEAIAEGQKWIAYASPHETGLAFDIGNNGLAPISATRAKQRNTRLYKWLVANAHKYGITPYKREPWHWEVRLPRESWASGEEFTDNFAVVVIKAGKAGTIPTTAKKVTTQMLAVNQCVSTVKDVVG